MDPHIALMKLQVEVVSYGAYGVRQKLAAPR